MATSSRPVRTWSRAWSSPLPSNPPLLALPAGIIPRSLASPGFRGPDGGLGYADQAQRRSQEAPALAQHVAHTPSPAFAESYAAMHSQSRRDIVAMQACAEALMALASQQGFVIRYEQGRRALTHRTCKERRHSLKPDDPPAGWPVLSGQRTRPSRVYTRCHSTA
jgi:hypothetical protein